MAYQTADVLHAMEEDSGIRLTQLKVDGGASVNNGMMQFQADLLNVPVVRPVVSETTALGAAYLAGLAVGYWRDMSDVTGNWALDRQFNPDMPDEKRSLLRRRWKKAVERSLAWED
jgi:glycerol kinase